MVAFYFPPRRSFFSPLTMERRFSRFETNQAWGRTSGGADAGIVFLSDANAELSRALGLSIEGGILVRTKRFSLITDDGVVTHYFSSAKESSDTWAPNVLAAL